MYDAHVAILLLELGFLLASRLPAARGSGLGGRQVLQNGCGDKPIKAIARAEDAADRNVRCGVANGMKDCLPC
jgi:hypothetical protein